MKRIVIAIFALMVVAVGFAKTGGGLLWKVSGNGLEAPTYILGTHHLAPVEFIDSISGLREALSQVDAVYGEVEKDSLTGPAAQRAMMAYSIAPADSVLSKLFTPAEFAEVDSLLTQCVGQKGLLAQMDMFKPAVVSTQISMMQIMKAFPQISLAEAFDSAIMSLGESMGKTIGGLETMESQLKLLLGEPLTVQAQDLLETVRNNDKLIEQALALTEAYLSQDLDAITAITVDPEYGIEPENLDRLIYNRNRAWADELDSIMRRNPVLVVVGCGHLGGDQGLLNLLSGKGYNVEPVSKN